MEDKDVVMIPFVVHEGDMARQERTIKRLWILCILLVILLCGSNAAWFYHESQYEDVVTTTQEVIQGNMLPVWLFAACAALWRVLRSIWYKYPHTRQNGFMSLLRGLFPL